MPPFRPAADREPINLGTLGSRASLFLKKYRYPLYGLWGFLFFLALFYVFALFDPNTLFNSRQGFEGVMDAVFGPNNWRVSQYAYSYQDRTMTVRDVWLTGLKNPTKGDLLVHASELAISHLTWARDLKAIFRSPKSLANGPDLASKVVAKDVRFFAKTSDLELRGSLAILEVKEPRLSPNPLESTASSKKSPPPNSLLALFRPTSVKLEKLRLLAEAKPYAASFALSLPSWVAVSPRRGPKGLIFGRGSYLGGVSFGLNAKGYALSGRLDELAHAGEAGLGFFNNLGLRNLTLWLDPSFGLANLDRATKKNETPPLGELFLGDATIRYLDFQEIAQKIAKRLVANDNLNPQTPDPRDLLTLVTLKDAFLGGVTIESHLKLLNLKAPPLTAQVDQGELSITAGQKPYALAARFVNGWYSLAESPKDGEKSQFLSQVKALGLDAGRFNVAAQAGYEPDQRVYQLEIASEWENLLGLSFSLDVAGLTPTLYESLGKTSLKAAFSEGDVPLGVKDLALKKTQLRVQDQGLTERIINSYDPKTSPPNAAVTQKERLIFGLGLFLTLNLENYLENSRELTDVMANFIRKPGVLTLKAEPTPAISYQGYQGARTIGELLNSAHLSVSLDGSEPVAFKWSKNFRGQGEPSSGPLDWVERPERGLMTWP
ncbi:MAG: hypothetical protein LBI10_05715 [Deltaproteobacteria bacterium]|jgi:hypothetical protein|nr:hypothetical protein [Deltaproteobacteria bacterium]